MRFRVQQVDRPSHRRQLFPRTSFVFCTQAPPSHDWNCRIVHDLELDKALSKMGFEDHRDTYEIYKQARAAIREFGPGQGYVEYDLDREQDKGPVRCQGDLRGAPPDGAR